MARNQGRHRIARRTKLATAPLGLSIANSPAVDSFAEEDHNPFSDHDDFANVMPDRIMDRLGACVNEGRKCRE